MLLFLDTETTGLYQYDKRSDDPVQPKIIELAALFTDDTGKEYGAFNVLIDHGVDIPAEATAVHGITREDCERFGFFPDCVIELLNHLVAFDPDLIIGHNLSFDLKMIRSMMGKDLYELNQYPKIPTYCTMLKSTNICKIPKAKGNGWKWPRLGEAYNALLGKEMIGGHRAMQDVRATAEIYFKLKGLGL